MGMATMECCSPLMASYLQRKKFFEPQLMVNPPPMAEQFLFDLRRMILIARERIRTRRHIPRLGAIAELEDEKDEAAQQQVAKDQAAYKELVKAEKREPLKTTQLNEELYEDQKAIFGVLDSSPKNTTFGVRILEDKKFVLGSSESLKSPNNGVSELPDQKTVIGVPVSQHQNIRQQENLVGTAIAKDDLDDEKDQLITMEEIVRQQQLLRQSLNASGSPDGNLAGGSSSPRSTKSADDSGRGDSKKDDADSDCSLGDAESDASTATNSREDEKKELKELEELQIPVPVVETSLAVKKVTELVREFESPSLQTKQPQPQSRLITPRKVQHSAVKTTLFQPAPVMTPAPLTTASVPPPTAPPPMAPAPPPMEQAIPPKATLQLTSNDQTTSVIAPVPTSRIPRVTAIKSPRLAPKFSVAAPPPSDQQQPNPPNFPPPPLPTASASKLVAPEQLRADKLRGDATNGHFGFSSSMSAAKKRPNTAVSGSNGSGLPTPANGAYAVYPSDSMKKSLPRRKKVLMSLGGSVSAAPNGKAPTVM